MPLDQLEERCRQLSGVMAMATAAIEGGDLVTLEACSRQVNSLLAAIQGALHDLARDPNGVRPGRIEELAGLLSEAQHLAELNHRKAVQWSRQTQEALHLLHQGGRAVAGYARLAVREGLLDKSV